MQGLRVVFMGTPDFAATALQYLIDSSHEVIAVYSQPPRPKGRGQQIHKSPVHLLAEEHSIPVHTPKNFKDTTEVDNFSALQADIAVVAAYGLILPQAILDAPRLGCINIHGSLLPRWRGAAPIHRAILAGDHETGITIMQMEAGLDTGPMISIDKVAITDGMTTGILHDALAAMGARMIVDVLDKAQLDGKIISEIQPDEGITYADKISKEETKIDWSQPAFLLERKIRAFHPFPGTWCMSGEKRLKIISAQLQDGSGVPGNVLNAQGDVACLNGALRLITVQPEGKTPMDISAAFNGGYLKPGDLLR